MHASEVHMMMERLHQSVLIRADPTPGVDPPLTVAPSTSTNAPTMGCLE